MKKIRVLFYRPKIDGHIVDNGIGIWTGLLNTIGLTVKFKGNFLKARRIVKALMCSHMEIWTIGEDGHWMSGQCWTSTMRGPESGVCVRSASEILKHPERWFYAEFDVYDHLLTVLNRKVKENKGYDKALIGRFFGLWWMGDKEKYICSEFVNEVLLDILLKFVFWELVNKKWRFIHRIVTKLKTTMSPLLSAITLHECGVKFFEVKDGKEIKV